MSCRIEYKGGGDGCEVDRKAKAICRLLYRNR